MTRNERKFAILLSLACLLISCGEAAAGTADANTLPVSEAVTETAAEEVTQYVDAVPKRDYGGETFTFLTRLNDANGYWGHFEFYAAETNAVPVNDAVFARNKRIEQRFNVVFDEYCTDTWTQVFAQTIAAQEDAYDCVPLFIPTAATAAVNGQLLNYSALEHIDLDALWWDPVLNDIFTIGGQQYFAVGDLTLLDKEATYLIMFNKDVAREHQVEDLYALVDNGTWTIDRMMQICSAITQDLDGDGKFTVNDRVGMVTDNGATLEAMYYSCGGRFTEKNEQDMPEYRVDMERSVKIIETIQNLYHSNDIMLAQTLSSQGIPNPWSDAGINGMFKQGRALLYGISLTVMSKMRDMDSDFGVLPYPKLDETQEEYTSFVYQTADCICVPITCTDPERTSAILEALCCESANLVMPAYYDVTITDKTTRDEKSREMLDYIFDHRTIDPMQLFDWGGMNAMLYTIKSADTFASSLAKREKAAQKDMEKTFASMNEQE